MADKFRLENPLHKDGSNWVFTTEGHPLRVPNTPRAGFESTLTCPVERVSTPKLFLSASQQLAVRRAFSNRTTYPYLSLAASYETCPSVSVEEEYTVSVSFNTGSPRPASNLYFRPSPNDMYIDGIEQVDLRASLVRSEEEQTIQFDVFSLGALSFKGQQRNIYVSDAGLPETTRQFFSHMQDRLSTLRLIWTRESVLDDTVLWTHEEDEAAQREFIDIPVWFSILPSSPEALSGQTQFHPVHVLDNTACSPSFTDPSLKDKVVIVKRGDCTISQKAYHLARSGAKAMIMYNTSPTVLHVSFLPFLGCVFSRANTLT